MHHLAPIRAVASLRTLPGLIVLSVSLGLGSCGDKASTSNEAQPASAEGGDKSISDPSGPADSAAASADEGSELGEEAGATKLDAGAAEDDAAAALDVGAAEAGEDEGGAEEAGDQPPADPKALLEEVKRKKTTDERAKEALQQAEDAGAKPLDLAKAANARGEALHADPDRAAEFYQWAADKAPKYPVPVFNLAKQEAVKGEVDATKKHLAEVKARGGNKLLQQIEFDPMWEIVKDDPEVRALLEG